MFRRQESVRVILFAGTALAAAMSTPAFAADAQKDTQVGEVIVTARRVAERLQDVPSSITAVGQKQLDVLKPRTLEDLSGFAPNVNIGRVGAGAGTSAIYVRGLGYSDVEKGQNPAVELIIDDVVIGTNFGQLVDPFDVSQIEVDRGPSGIFYGRNSIGGVVNIHRTKPTREWGSDRRRRLRRLQPEHRERWSPTRRSDPTAGLKISASHQQRDGFLEQHLHRRPRRTAASELTTGNLQFDWNITPKLEANLGGHAHPPRWPGNARRPGRQPDRPGSRPRFWRPAGIKFNQYGSPYIPGVTVPLGPWQVASDFPDRNNSDLTDLQPESRLMIPPIGQFTSDHGLHEGERRLRAGFRWRLRQLHFWVAGSVPGHRQPADRLPAHLAAAEIRPVHRGVALQPRLRRPRQTPARASTISTTISRRSSSLGRWCQACRSPRPFTNQISGDITESKAGFGNLIFNVTSRLHVSAGLRYISESTSVPQRLQPALPPRRHARIPQRLRSGERPAHRRTLPNGFTGPEGRQQARRQGDDRLSADHLTT